MKVSIHQPSYWPWLGLLAKIAKSDLYVCLDSVDAARDDYQYRNIFYCGGEAKFLTLPVTYRMGTPLADLEFKNDSWKTDHLNKLANYYRKAPFFEPIYERIAPIYAAASGRVVDFLLATMAFACEQLDIRVPVCRSSGLGVSGHKGELVLEICRRVQATEYVAGLGSFEYMQSVLPAFEAADIAVSWHRFTHPEYSQERAKPFVPGLACLDLFFFHGPERSHQIFRDTLHVAA